MKNNLKGYNTSLILPFFLLPFIHWECKKVTNEAPAFQLTETQTPTLWCQHKEMNTHRGCNIAPTPHIVSDSKATEDTAQLQKLH